MFRHPRFVGSSAVIALLAVAMFSSGDRALAIQGTEGKVLLGPIGVAKNEAVRLNICAIGDPDDVPWDFVVRIFNTRGELGAERRSTTSPQGSRAPRHQHR